MRTRFSRRQVSVCEELPPHSYGVQRQVFTCGAVLARLIQIYGARVERLTIAVANSEYHIPAATLSASMLREHLSGGNNSHS